MHSPYAFQFMNKVLRSRMPEDVQDSIERQRRIAVTDNTPLLSIDKGAGTNSDKPVTIGAQIARSSSSKRKGELLYLIAEFVDAEKILELGTSGGIGTSYLAKGSNALVFSIEFRSELASKARENFSELGLESVEVIEGSFDSVLPTLEDSKFDLIYIDGNHTKESTVKYFQWATDHLTDMGLIVMDDIYWSREMTEAWELIRYSEDVKLSLNLYHFGVISLNPGYLQPQHLTIH